MLSGGYVASYDHPAVGRLDQIGRLFSLSDTPAQVQGRPLIVGEQTREILTELGYSQLEIDELCNDGRAVAWRQGDT